VLHAVVVEVHDERVLGDAEVFELLDQGAHTVVQPGRAPQLARHAGFLHAADDVVARGLQPGDRFFEQAHGGQQRVGLQAVNRLGYVRKRRGVVEEEGAVLVGFHEVQGGLGQPLLVV